MVGTNDNAEIFYYATKKVKIAAGETYVYTLTNYNNANNSEEWKNWVVEGNLGDKYFDCEARGNLWQAGGGPTPVYTPVINTSDVANWQTAYNGAIVTITISRNAAGDQFTVTHTSNIKGTTDGNTDKYYGGTWTVAVGAEEEWDIYITEEYSHFLVTKVAYTHSSGGAIYSMPKMTYVNYDAATTSYGEIAYDAASRTGYNNISAGSVGFVNSGWGVNYITYVNADASDVPGGSTITAASLAFSQSGSTDNKRTTGVGAGYNSSTWSNSMTYNTADKSITTVGDVVWTSTKSASVFESKSISILEAFRGDADNIVNILLYETAAAGCYIKNPELSITYTTAAAYDITFTETNSVAATIKIDDTDVTAGATLVNGDYSFTATAAGYEDYNGNFTVSGADQNVEFTMTAKTVYNYSVNAIDGESGVLKSSIVSGTCYADETTSFYLPECVLVDGTLYFRTAEDSYKSVTVTSNNQVFTYAYTTSSVDNVVFFVEGESISGASTSTATNNQRLASNGYMGRGSNLALTTLPIGSYTIYVHYINTNKDAHTVVVNAGETAVINNASVSARPTINGSVTLTESMAITLTAGGSSTSGVDYIYIVQTAEVATISSLGWSTLYSPYALDFSDVDGLTAYTASVSGETVTLTEVDDVPANTGVVLNGTANTTYNIPITSSSSTAQGDLTGNAAASTAYDAVTGHTYYVLAASADANYKVQFRPVTSGSIAAGKAFLDITDASVKAFNVVFDLETGINTKDNGLLTNNNCSIYNLTGQRMNKLQKGINIVNGKKYIIK